MTYCSRAVCDGMYACIFWGFCWLYMLLNLSIFSLLTVETELNKVEIYARPKDARLFFF